MLTRPDFTAAQRKQLVKLGCEPEQIAQLRNALTEIRRVLYRRAARSDVEVTLSTVAEHADALLKELTNIAMQTNAARAEANVIIETAYWQAFPDDGGPWSAHHMLPRLRVVADAAHIGIEALPAKPTRHHTADWHPIARIDAALVYGWSKTHCRVYTVESDTLTEFVAHAKAHRPPGPYPEKFRPSASAGSVFREIVGICYEAAGATANADPLRAIRDYRTHKRKRNADDLSGLSDVLDAPARAPAPRRKNRTSKKT